MSTSASTSAASCPAQGLPEGNGCGGDGSRAVERELPGFLPGVRERAGAAPRVPRPGRRRRTGPRDPPELRRRGRQRRSPNACSSPAAAALPSGGAGVMPRKLRRLRSPWRVGGPRPSRPAWTRHPWPGRSPEARPAAKPAMNVVSGAAGRTTEWAATPARARTSFTSISTSSSSRAWSRARHQSSSVSSWLFTVCLQGRIQLGSPGPEPGSWLTRSSLPGGTYP